jgi:hypothetical protein
MKPSSLETAASKLLATYGVKAIWDMHLAATQPLSTWASLSWLHR